jgi:hypothetical protein
MKGCIMKLLNPAPFEMMDRTWNEMTQIEQVRYISALKRRQTYRVVTVVENGAMAGMTRVIDFNVQSDAERELRDTIDMQCGSVEIITSAIIRITASAFPGPHSWSHRETIMEEKST